MTTKTMRGILIPADDALDVRSVELDSIDGSTLASLQRLVGGLIEALPYPDDRAGLTAYVNEEGKILNLPWNARATILMRPVLFTRDYIAGDLVITGFDPREGETIDLPAGITPAWIEATVAA